MAGRIPIYRRVGDVLRMRPGKADRGICTSCHRIALESLPSCPAQLDDLSPSMRLAGGERTSEAIGARHCAEPGWVKVSLAPDAYRGSGRRRTGAGWPRS